MVEITSPQTGILRERRGARLGAAAAVCLLAGLSPLGAQESQMRQFEQLKQPGTSVIQQQAQAPESARGIAPIEDDEEIGRQFLLKRRAGVPQFAANGDVQYHYTSNRLLTDTDAKGDGVLVGTAGASWNPTWIKDITGSVFARQQFFRYNTETAIDFDATSVGFNAGTRVEPWFNLSGGYSWTRLVSCETDDEFYKEGDLSLVLHRVHVFNQRLVLPYGYTFDFFHASPDEFTRCTHGLFAGVNWALTAKLLVQFIYRLQIENYLSENRDDLANILSASVTYTFTPWASARIFTSFNANESNIDRDYNVFNSGIGASLVWRF